MSLCQHLTHLNHQLDRCREDIETLQAMKEKALNSPDEFVSFLKAPQSRQAFPKMQRILRVPDLDIRRYQIRLTRRANTRFEQNLDYLLSRAQEIHCRQALMEPPVFSYDFPILHNSNDKRTESSTQISGLREKFWASLNVPGGCTAAEIDSYINPTTPIPTNTPTIANTNTPVVPVYQPRPRQPVRFATASPHGISDDMTDLNPIDYHHSKSTNSFRPSSVPPLSVTPISMPTSPTTTAKSANSIKIRVRKPSSQTPEQTSITHNIPWSDDEKRKLEYLLTVFPEEEIQARRYAKIAAALGTRTGNQVASRVQKLSAKAQRNKERALKAEASNGADSQTIQLVAELESFFAASTDPKVKESPEYAEYLRLKEQLESIAENPINGVLHVGFKCDCCGIEPIIGPRWTCCSCPKEVGPVDLCGICVSKGFQTQHHKLFHVMKKIDFSEDSEMNGD